MPRRLGLLALAASLAGCVAVPQPRTESAPATARPPAPPPQVSRPAPAVSGFRAPRVMSLPGLEHIIGRNATALANIFGPPRLTVNEGDARKLQFTGPACVLDVYLYPLGPGAEPTATYLEARRASDGMEVDRAACAAALRR